jgi:hypothetical protein
MLLKKELINIQYGGIVMKKFSLITCSLLVANSLGYTADNSLPPAESIMVTPSKVDPKQYSEEARALVIGCMDFRLPDETAQFLQRRGLLDQYDYISWPGATLAISNDENSEMTQQMLKAIGLSNKLHHTKRIILIDHRDCGAYKLKFGPEHAQEKGKETEIHKDHMMKVKKLLDEKFPDLEKEFLLLGLDGKVETIIPVEKK